jgi:hypothetical protein
MVLQVQVEVELVVVLQVVMDKLLQAALLLLVEMDPYIQLVLLAQIIQVVVAVAQIVMAVVAVAAVEDWEEEEPVKTQVEVVVAVMAQ